MTTLQIIFLCTTFAVGATIGSFLGVFVTRHHHKSGGIIFGDSQCDSCKKKLKVLDLIPLISYTLSKGKCRHCSHEINKYHFYIELITGFIFTIIAIQSSFLLSQTTTNLIELLLYLGNATILTAILFYDFLYQEIPDILTVPGSILAALTAYLLQSPSPSSIAIALAITLTFLGGQILISKGKWLGLGDLTLGIYMSILLGWKALVLALGSAYILGACFALTLIFTGKAIQNTEIAFGPFLVTGTFISLLWAPQIITWYTDLLYI